MIQYPSKIHAKAVSKPTARTLYSVASVPVCIHTRINEGVRQDAVRCCVSLSAPNTPGALSTASRGRNLPGPARMVHASVQEPGRRPQQQQVQAYAKSDKNSTTITAAPGATAAGRTREEVANARLCEVWQASVGQGFDPGNEASISDNRLTIHAFRREQGASNSSVGKSTQCHTVISGCFARVSRAQQTAYSGVMGFWCVLALCGLARAVFISWLDTRPQKTPPRPLAAADVFASIDEKKTAVKIAAPVVAPGADYGPVEAQLAKQFRDLMRHPIPGVSAAPDDENPLVWHVRLAGPEGTPYAGGWFNVELRFDENFPGTRPQAAFRTKIWHPNVDVQSGLVCLDIGDQVCSVGCVLSALQQLLKHPNPDAPRRIQCAYEMLNCPEVYWQKAKRMTLEYAMS